MRHPGVIAPGACACVISAISVITACNVDHASGPIVPSALTGSVAVHVNVSGNGGNPGGFVVSINATAKPVGANGTVTFDSLPPGQDYTVRISKIADFCAPTAREVYATVKAGARAEAAFNVECYGEFAFTSFEYDSLNYGYAGTLSYVTRDGETRRLSTAAAFENYTLDDWSPDGTKILIESMTLQCANGTVGCSTTSSRLWIVNADGSGRTRLTDGALGTCDLQGRWSPTGDAIAFIRTSCLGTRGRST